MYTDLYVKYRLLSDFNETNFLGRFSKNTEILKLVKIRPVGAELFQADRRNDTRDEPNSHVSQRCERA